jgi:hypothetical protein
MSTINVRPKTEIARKFIKHHPSGLGFSDNPEGTSWPDDAFTQRRIRDGDIEVVTPAETGPPPMPEEHALHQPDLPTGTREAPVGGEPASDATAIDPNAPRITEGESTAAESRASRE